MVHANVVIHVAASAQDQCRTKKPSTLFCGARYAMLVILLTVQTTFSLSAAVLPLLDTSSYSTACPSWSVLAGLFNGRDVNENVSATAIRRLNKSVSLGRVEPLHCALGHTKTPMLTSDGTQTLTRAKLTTFGRGHCTSAMRYHVSAMCSST